MIGSIHREVPDLNRPAGGGGRSRKLQKLIPTVSRQSSSHNSGIHHLEALHRSMNLEAYEALLTIPLLVQYNHSVASTPSK